MSAAPLRVVHIATGLETGGAEVMLLRLLEATDRARFEPAVISLTGRGPIGERIARLGIPVRALELSRRAPNPLLLARLVAWLRELRPAVVQCWMHDADLLGGLAARAAGGAAVAWGIHQGVFDPGIPSQRRVLRVAWLCARLSRQVPARIVCCSETSRRVHAAMGYDAARMVVIENGFDLDLFRPDPASRDARRQELGIPLDAQVVVQVARFHPHKDQRTFVRAAGLLAVERPDVRFVLCGDRLDADNGELGRWIDEARIRPRIHLLGRRDDVPRLLPAFDVYASSSSSEAFPLVLGEAMAAGLPCVATDVGDTAALLGGIGRLVLPVDPAALARGMRELLDLGPAARASLGEAARQRIATHFTLARTAARYGELHQEIARR